MKNKKIKIVVSAFLTICLASTLFAGNVLQSYAMNEISSDTEVKVKTEETEAFTEENIEEAIEEMISTEENTTEENTTEEITNIEETPTIEENVNKEDKPQLTLQETVGNLLVTLYAPAGIFTEDAVLKVEEIVTTDKIENAIEGEVNNISEIHSFDISVICGDEEIHELDGSVQITFSNVELEADESAAVIYVDEQAQNAEVMTEGEQSSDVTFSTTHFSNYNVVITKTPTAVNDTIALTLLPEGTAKIALGVKKADLKNNTTVNVKVDKTDVIAACCVLDGDDYVLNAESLGSDNVATITVEYYDKNTNTKVTKKYEITVLSKASTDFDTFVNAVQSALYEGLQPGAANKLNSVKQIDSTVPSSLYNIYHNAQYLRTHYPEGFSDADSTWRIIGPSNISNALKGEYTVCWTNADLSKIDEDTKSKIYSGQIKMSVKCYQSTFKANESTHSAPTEIMVNVVKHSEKSFIVLEGSLTASPVIEAPDTYTVKYILADGLAAQGYTLNVPYNDSANTCYSYTKECSDANRITSFGIWLKKDGSAVMNVEMTLADDVSGYTANSQKTAVTYPKGTVISVIDGNNTKVNYNNGGAGNGFGFTAWNPDTEITIVVGLPKVNSSTQTSTVTTPTTATAAQTASPDNEDEENVDNAAGTIAAATAQVQGTQNMAAFAGNMQNTIINAVGNNAGNGAVANNIPVAVIDETPVPLSQNVENTQKITEENSQSPKIIVDEDVPLAKAPKKCLFHYILLILTALYAGYSIYSAKKKANIIHQLES